ncbi:MAG: pyruvate kinase [Synergistaceae bacterium]|nr:pyruvate kinase [Synergistaceae bacterium]
MERRVKIVCTIGPACWDYDTLSKLAEKGMNVARLNFSHGDHESHGRTLKNVRAVEQELQSPIALLLDTKGPEIRTGELAGHGSVTLKAGDRFTLFFEKKAGDEKGVSIDYPPLAREVGKGQSIFIDDGAINLEVEECSDEGVVCRVIVGGELGERKGVNVPGADLSVPTLTEKDIADLRWGAANSVDYVAVSFVRSKEDIIEVRRILEAEGASAKIIAKMETRQSVENIDEILEVVDGMMVARGDLGVEMNAEDVPMVQKEIIEKCRIQGKPVIVATQMLDSMIRSPRPTRAEANDVANAVIDGADAVMLSGETANGIYPAESVEMMNRIIVRTEKDSELWQRRPCAPAAAADTADAVSHAARGVAQEVGAAAIVSLTTSGGTARMVAKYRPPCPIIAMTPSLSTWRQLSLVWGVEPAICPFASDLEQSVNNAITLIKKEQFVESGDNVVITSGVPLGEPGSTNMLNVFRIAGIVGKGLSLVRRSVTAEVCRAETPEEALKKIGENKILVIRKSKKEFIPAIERAAAVITEEGGLTSHAGVTSLNRGIPCITGVADVMDKVKDGMTLTVDGVHGVIYAGRAG